MDLPSDSRPPRAQPSLRQAALWLLLLAAAAVGWTAATHLLGLRTAALLTAALPAGGAAAYLLWRRPELGLFLLLGLVSFGSEYSQTDWGVRSADDLTTIYNLRLIPAVTASLFDYFFAAMIALWGLRKLTRREPMALPPRRFWPPLLLAAVFLGYATLLGLLNLPNGFALYHILRELRPFLYGLLTFLLAVDIITLRGAGPAVWKLTLLLAFTRGIQGIVRHYLGIGRDYYGTRMVYYDYADTILLLAALSFLFGWLLTRRRLRPATLLLAGVASLPLVYSFVFSFRRSFWVGTALSLGLLLLYMRGRERLRYAQVAAVAGLALLGLAAIVPGQQRAVVAQRILSITDTEEDPSNYFRIFDTENSLNAILESGALGMGFGSRYRVVASIYWLDDFINHVSRTSHNGYLYVTMKMGLLGLLSWTAYWLAHLWVAIRLARDPRPFARGVGLAVGLILVACAVANTFLPLYYNVRPMIMLAIWGGLATALLAGPHTLRDSV